MGTTAMAPAPQHMRALAQANRVRLARAELKRRVADGEITVAEVVLQRPWEADTMTISDLLQAQRRWGRTRCRRCAKSTWLIRPIRAFRQSLRPSRLPFAISMCSKRGSWDKTARFRAVIHLPSV